MMTGELKQQHIERIANREMITELDSLIQELELDEEKHKIMCSSYGASLRGAHTNALVALADKELSQSLSALDGVVRAVKLKRMALSAEQARATHNGRFSEYEIDIDKSVYAEIRAFLEPRVTKYAFDMASEPELSVIGLSPELSKYMDETLASPVKRHVAFSEIKRKESLLKKKGRSDDALSSVQHRRAYAGSHVSGGWQQGDNSAVPECILFRDLHDS
ncbi:hypothetical protein ACSPAH_16850 [Buttiauxella agrestis]